MTVMFLELKTSINMKEVHISLKTRTLNKIMLSFFVQLFNKIIINSDITTTKRYKNFKLLKDEQKGTFMEESIYLD
jgi:hypothetical protein